MLLHSLPIYWPGLVVVIGVWNSSRSVHVSVLAEIDDGSCSFCRDLTARLPVTDSMSVLVILGHEIKVMILLCWAITWSTFWYRALNWEWHWSIHCSSYCRCTYPYVTSDFSPMTIVLYNFLIVKHQWDIITQYGMLLSLFILNDVFFQTIKESSLKLGRTKLEFSVSDAPALENIPKLEHGRALINGVIGFKWDSPFWRT